MKIAIPLAVDDSSVVPSSAIATMIVTAAASATAPAMALPG